MLPDPARTLPDVSLVIGPDGLPRCGWADLDPTYRAYHDLEWGRPLHGDLPLFEKLCLEGFQAGLSWIIVLRRRETIRAAFDRFDPHRIAAYGDQDVARLLADPGIIRNRLKVQAAITNARALLALRDREGDGALDRLIWSHAPTPRPESERPRALADVQAQTADSVALSTALKREGFRFVGPVSVYALMQSAGLVDDHLAGCSAIGATPPR